MMDEITDAQAARIMRGHCPDCGHRGFCIGPQGGLSLNIECGNSDCRARFNATFYSGRLMFAERIERRSEGGALWPSEPEASCPAPN